MKSNRTFLFTIIIMISIFLQDSILFSQEKPDEKKVITECLVLGLKRSESSRASSQEEFESRILLNEVSTPKEGEEVHFSNGTSGKWEKVTAGKEGWFDQDAFRSCIAYVNIKQSDDETILLEGMSHSLAYVNGAPRAGNPYQYKEEFESWEPAFNYSILPVKLKKGNNDLFFACNRGRLKIVLHKPSAKVLFNAKDVTLPDLVVNTATDTYGAIVVINTTDEPLKDYVIASQSGNGENIINSLPVIQPYSVRKVMFKIKNEKISQSGEIALKLSLAKKSKNGLTVLDNTGLQLKVKEYGDTRKETFISEMDGSLQYYAVNPASGISKDEPAALFLSLHGASVEAINQAGSYFPKSWGHIVAPTNRRPYGFNWEDWGRLDAFEVMDIAKKEFNIDESRVYLMGHSMGGHGTWHIGANFPDRFAAIGPSAGWISFWTYRSRPVKETSSPMLDMLNRGTLQSRTFSLTDNFKQLGIYIIHGAADDVVSPDQARMMADTLNKKHMDYIYYEQPGAGHWWDNSKERGADCVDWTPLFDFFARHSRPLNQRVRDIEFLTANPGVSASDYWITVEAQIAPLKMSSVKFHFDPGEDKFTGSTGNVERFSIDCKGLTSSKNISVEIDTQKISDVKLTIAGKAWFENKSGKWQNVSEPSLSAKGPHRNGTFKDAFRHNMVFVYSTNGTSEENKWTFEKAKYDAERFWYQGNGSIDVVADKDFNAAAEKDRNVILYGNSVTNSAWKLLLADSPVQVIKDRVILGTEEYKGKDLCCLFLRPRPGSDIACVGAVSGTGLAGMKLANIMPYFTPGAGLPDCTIVNTEAVTKGNDHTLAAGFWGNDWGYSKDNFNQQ